MITSFTTQIITKNIAFASIGLLDMFNSTGAVEKLEIEESPEIPANNNGTPVAKIALKVRGCGRFGVYFSQKPLKCSLDNTETDFSYEAATGLVTLTIPVPEVEMYKWSMEIIV